MTETANVSAADRFGLDSPLLLRAGEATLFLAAVGGDGRPLRRTRVVTVRAPALIAARPAPDEHRWIVGPGLGSVLEEATLDTDERLMAEAVARTTEALGEVVRPLAPPPTERVVRLEARPANVPNVHGAVVDATAWVKPVAGTISLAHVPVPPVGAPLAARLPVYGEGDAVASAQPFEDVAVATLIDGVEWLCAVAAEHVLEGAEERHRADADAARRAAREAHEAEQAAVDLLAQQLRAKPEPVVAPGTDPLVASMVRVLAPIGVEPTAPRAGLGELEGTAAVNALAAASGLYVRRVTLEGSWWATTDEPVLGFRDDGTPLALLPESGGITAVEPDGTPVAVGGSTAEGILDAGFVFSRPLVDDDVDRARVGRVAVARRGSAIATYLGWSALVAATGLAVPFASGVVFKSIVPHQDKTRLWFLLGVLVIIAIAKLALQVAAAAARTRVESTASLDIQRGIWGRILVSPVALVRRLGAGDTAMRLSAAEMARDPIEQTILSALPNMLTGLLAGLVLFYYDLALAAFVLAAGLVLLGVALLIARSAADAQKEVETATGAVNGFLYQVLVAIPKLRVAGAESRAFLAWAEQFTTAVGRRLMQAGARQIMLASLIPTLGSLALLAGVAAIGPDRIAVDVFVAFQTTYTEFLTGVTATVAAAGIALQMGPTLDRVVELAQEPVELAPDRAQQPTLRGEVGLADVTFRYLPGARPVVDGLTFRVEPGQLVAITGPSGGGKSTILRLLLGFEQPEQGSVVYDDQTLSSLDVGSVRRQLGVVLQDGQLMPGTVRQNLAGMATLSEADAWEVAELVALADDIRAMPMGMDTVITLSGGAFSGGQRQRLLIGRALAGGPRILLLDEATSALDNVAQRVITHNLADLGMTRIVVAHRLSTIAGADRILVVDRGRIVEDGTYEELIAKGGAFHALASRQLL